MKALILFFHHYRIVIFMVLLIIILTVAITTVVVSRNGQNYPENSPVSSAPVQKPKMDKFKSGTYKPAKEIGY